MSERSIAVIVVSYNVCDDLDGCLRALEARRDPFTAHITIVDNGSRDGTIEMLRRRWPSVQIITAETNLGFGRANNLGVERTQGELVLFLNPDALVDPDAIGLLVDALDAHPEVAAVGPRLVDADGRPELSFGWEVTPLGELRQKRLVTRAARGSDRARARIDRWTRRAGPRLWLSGACLLVRRSDFVAVGGFDARYFMYYEDVDLCARLRARGRTVRFVPTASVRHLRGRSGGSNPDLERRRRESQMTYYQTHQPGWVPILRWYHRLR